MLAEMVIGLGLDAANLKKGLDDAEATLGGKAAAIGKGMTSAGKTLTAGLTLPIIALGGYALHASNEFNTAMGNVASLIPGNTKRVGELKRGVQDLAIETGNSTGDLADGLYQVTSAFGDTADSMAILKTNAIAARGGLATTTEAIALTSAVTKAYGDTSAAAVQKAADLAAVTVRLGQTTFPELAAAMPKVTALGKSLGASQEELFAAMAATTGVTGNAAEVATQMKGVMAGLLAPTSDAAATFKKLGYESGAAAVKGLGFQGAMKALVDESKASGKPLQKFLGSIEGQQLALALAGPQGASYAKALKEMAGASGASTKAFEAQTGGANKNAQTMKQLQQQVQVAAQRIGDGLAPALSSALEAAMPLVGGITKLADKFANASPTTQKLVVGFAAVVAAVGPLLIGLGMLVTAFTTVAPVAVAAWAAITGPIGLVVIAIAAVVAAGVLLYRNWDTVKEKLGAAWDWIKDKASSVWSWIKQFVSDHAVLIAAAVTGPIGALAVWLYKNWDDVKAKASTAWQAIKSFIGQHAVAIVTAVTGPIGGLVAWTIRNWGDIRQGVATAWATIKSTASSWAGNVASAIKGAIDDVVGKVAAVWASVRTGIATAWQAIVTTATGWAGKVVSGIVGGLNDIIGKLGSIGSSAGKALAEGIRTAINGIISKWNGLTFTLPKISLPDKLGGGSVGGQSFGTPDIPMLAKGGIAYGPTLAGVGEYPGAGGNPEVIAPLDRLRSLLGGSGGGGTTIMVNVDNVSSDYDVSRIGEALVRELRLRGVSL